MLLVCFVMSLLCRRSDRPNQTCCRLRSPQGCTLSPRLGPAVQPSISVWVVVPKAKNDSFLKRCKQTEAVALNHSCLGVIREAIFGFAVFKITAVSFCSSLFSIFKARCVSPDPQAHFQVQRSPYALPLRAQGDVSPSAPNRSPRESSHLEQPLQRQLCFPTQRASPA